MILLIVFIFTNSALLTISTPTYANLPTNNELSNKSRNESHNSSDFIVDDTQNETEPKLDHNKKLSREFLKNVINTVSFPSDVNKDNKIISDNDNKRKYKLTRGILGELIITFKIFFENNYNELEQYSKLYWNTFKSIKDQIEEMQYTKSSIQRLLQKYYNINFNE